MNAQYPKEFSRQIREALQNLHDFASLQKVPLAAQTSGPHQTLAQGVRQLRSELLSAIDQLNPAGNLPGLAKERRPYAILYGRYVQGLTTTELMEELAISERQLRREHARALHAVTELMWNWQAEAVENTLVHPHATAQGEAEQLIHQARVESLALPPLVGDLIATLAPVAAQKGIVLENRVSAGGPVIQANRVVLRQGITELFSYALRNLATGRIFVDEAGTGEIGIVLRAMGVRRAAEPPSTGLEISQKLIGSMGGKISVSDSAEGWRAAITFPAPEDRYLLVMDDNAGLIELFRRYLAGGRYRIVEAHTAEEAILASGQYLLRMILLDVMMPEQDGWEILERLRATPETKSIPIIVCSVLNEPEIAFTLGASDYLTKPVTQLDLLKKVEYWCDVQSAPAEPSKAALANN
jgi:CheY-like chemotaxis protein